MTHCVLAIDQGTTGTTALLLDKNVSVIAQANVEFPNHYPEPGHVEHDVEEIWASVEAAVTAALAKVSDVEIVAIGITNQRETPSGMRRLGRPSTERWSGRIAGRRTSAQISRRPATKTACAARPGWSWTPTSREPRPSGCSTMCRMLERVPSAASFSLAPSTRGSPGASVARTRRTPATRRGPCCSTSTPWTGMTACSASWMCLGRASLASVRTQRCWVRRAGSASCRTAFRWRGWPVISSPLCLAKPALARAMPSAPTGRAHSS